MTLPADPRRTYTSVDLIEELTVEDPRVEEGTIMGGRCARVTGEFLALVDYKGAGLVVKLPRSRVRELIGQGVGQPFAPAEKTFNEWVSIPEPNPERWAALLREAKTFVTRSSQLDKHRPPPARDQSASTQLRRGRR